MHAYIIAVTVKASNAEALPLLSQDAISDAMPQGVGASDADLSTQDGVMSFLLEGARQPCHYAVERRAKGWTTYRNVVYMPAMTGDAMLPSWFRKVAPALCDGSNMEVSIPGGAWWALAVKGGEAHNVC